MSEPTRLLFRDEPYARDCEAVVVAVEDGAVILDRTVFYPEAGGQVGDQGVLRCGETTLSIVDTKKNGALARHVLAESDRAPAPGAQVRVALNWPRRSRLMRTHSALHLLCAAVGGGVNGGQIGEDKGRLDFDLEAKPSKVELEEKLNSWIAANKPIRSLWIDAEELDQRPELVRTMSVAPPKGDGRVRLIEVEGVDLQACGGTHVASTGEIGRIEIGKIENKGKRNKRISLRLVD